MKQRITIICLMLLGIFSCNIFTNSVQIGEANISVRGNEIVATNFPRPAHGIAGLGTVSWNGFSFDEFDRFIYEQVQKTSNNTLYIVIQHNDEDSYGNKVAGKEITIGKIDVLESKKYQDFSHWHRNYKTYNMWAKDLDAYKRKYQSTSPSNDYSPSISIAPRYEPISIR